MDEWKKYVYKEQNIDGIDTYLIYPEHYSRVLELLNLCGCSLPVLSALKSVKSVKLYPAVLYIPRFIERFRWSPVLCYYDGQAFYHVQYHGAWRCRKCWANNGPVIMPLQEEESSYYGFPRPPIPEGFRKVNCKKCGNELQRHLIMLDEVEALDKFH